ncbi:MAG: hypothetical protein ACR2IK_07600 [Chloroflexota bacterium]
MAERYPHLAETDRAQGQTALATGPLVAHGHECRISELATDSGDSTIEGRVVVDARIVVAMQPELLL